MFRYYLTAYVTWSAPRGDTSKPKSDKFCRELTVGIDALSADEAIDIATEHLYNVYDHAIDVKFMPDETYISTADGPLVDWAVERWQSSLSVQLIN